MFFIWILAFLFCIKSNPDIRLDYSQKRCKYKLKKTITNKMLNLTLEHYNPKYKKLYNTKKL